MKKTYSELITIPDYFDRFRYLKIGGLIGDETFGSHRWVNQEFYRSREWKNFRNYIINRDKGCDMAFSDMPINGIITIHHINPLSYDDYINNPDALMDPNNVVAVWDLTHRAIHYGDERLLPQDYIPRTKNDTCPWR